MNFSNTKPILITGVSGFIGSRIAEILLSNDHSVVGIDDNNNFLYNNTLKRYRLAKLKTFSNFIFHKCNILEKPLTEILSKYYFETIFHLAGHAGIRTSIDKPEAYFQTNTMGTLNILDAVLSTNKTKYKCRINNIIFASTSSVYGNNTPPFDETQKTDVQLSPYSASKKSAEILLTTYNSLYEINTSILRYFTVYGPAGRPDMSILRFIHNIFNDIPITVFGDGEQKRDFTHIEDIANGSISAMNQSGFNIFNLGSDRPIKLSYVIKLIENFADKTANIKYEERHSADILETWANINKAKQVLKWEPKFSIENGIKETVEWYKMNKDWIKM